MSYKVTPDGLGTLQLNETDPVRSVLQNVAIILCTWIGTVPLYREFGITSKYIDMPISVVKPMLHADIRETIAKYEPRAEVVSVTFEERVDGLTPIVEVNILNE